MPGRRRAVLLQAMGGVFKKQAGRLLDGRTYDEFPRAERAA
jgi:protein gp37